MIYNDMTPSELAQQPKPVVFLYLVEREPTIIMLNARTPGVALPAVLMDREMVRLRVATQARPRVLGDALHILTWVNDQPAFPSVIPWDAVYAMAHQPPPDVLDSGEVPLHVMWDADMPASARADLNQRVAQDEDTEPQSPRLTLLKGGKA